MLLVLALQWLLVRTEPNSTTFLLIGDWGGTSRPPFTTPKQLRVAEAMSTIASQYEAKFVVSLGDHFYKKGLSTLGIRDPRFQKTFEEVYSHAALQIPWYMVAGNVDHWGNFQAQLDYTKQSSRWYFPAPNYVKIIPIPGSTATIQLIVFDAWDVTTNGHRGAMKNDEPDPERGTQALAWLTQQFQESTATWRILLLHWYLYNAGETSVVHDLVTNLEPIILKYKPDLVICGHEHSSQHLVVNETNYFILGGGSTASPGHKYDPSFPEHFIKFRYPKDGEYYGSFGSISVFEDRELKVMIWNQKADLLYSSVHYPNHPQKGTDTTLLWNMLWLYLLLFVLIFMVVYRYFQKRRKVKIATF